MAHGLFEHMVEEAGLSDEIEIESAGIGPWHIGESTHRGTIKVLKAQGINFQHTARQISSRDMRESDYLVAMDRSHIAGIRRGGKTDAEVVLLLDYAHGLNETEVPDPYYNDTFDYVYTLIENGLRGLLAHIRQQHNL